MSDDIRTLVETLGLTPHPEGGFYRETFRAPLEIGAPAGIRAASTAIYYLLPAGTFSALHRVSSDEVWHHYAGDPVDLYILDETVAPTDPKAQSVVALGPDIALGERPQRAIAAGLWQAAVPRGERFALCGCTVSPGFDFADFEMPSRDVLTLRMPHLREVIAKLARSG